MAGIDHRTHRRQEVLDILDICYRVFDCAASLINRRPELQSELRRTFAVHKMCVADAVTELNNPCRTPHLGSEDKETHHANQIAEFNLSPYSAFTPIRSILHRFSSNTAYESHPTSVESCFGAHQNHIPTADSIYNDSIPKDYSHHIPLPFRPSGDLASTPLTSAHRVVDQSEIDSGISACIAHGTNSVTPRLSNDSEHKSDIWRPYLN
ncbi:unnamed protein product [Dicrocoelium dendriticum]|nr:unnamed protein product [Dicrocoelium dendriticum]